MEHKPRPAIHLEKSQLTVPVGLEVGCDRFSVDLQSGANSVSQADGVSDMATPARAGFAGGRLRKGTIASAHLSVWERAVPQHSP